MIVVNVPCPRYYKDGTFPLVVGSDRDADEESDFAGTSSRFVENEGRAKRLASLVL